MTREECVEQTRRALRFNRLDEDAETLCKALLKLKELTASVAVDRITVGIQGREAVHLGLATIGGKDVADALKPMIEARRDLLWQEMKQL